MTFRESLISAGRTKYATFSGRASRSEFWWWYLTVLIAEFIAGAALLSNGSNGLTVAIQLIITIALFIPTLAVGIRRLHDTGRSAWYILFGLIPIVGTIILLVFFVQESQPGSNGYGANPSEA